MLSKKTLILTLVIALSMHCPNGRAQENRLPLRFALAVGTLINAPKPFIEVLSLKGAYVTGVETILLPLFPIRDGLPDKQESVAIEWWELKVHSRAASDNGSDSEDNSTSDERIDNRSNEDEANTESDVQYETTTLNSFRVSNETIQYCTTLALKNIKQEPVLDSEIAINGTSDESIDNRSNEDESDVQYKTTTLNPFRVSNEISQYGATLELKKIKEEPVSDTEILNDSEVNVIKVDAAKHQCDHEGCNYSTKRSSDLIRHKQTHLPADQRPKRPKRPKVYHCEHEACNYSTGHPCNLKMHKQIHLPANQRPKAHQCDHEGCNYSTDYSRYLKQHKQTHLPADQRPKTYRCDHEGCDYRTDLSHNLKRHRQTHLLASQRPKRPKRPKVHQCDHEGCDYGTDLAPNLKRHRQTHLLADQRPNRFKVHQCDYEGCDYETNHLGNLKRHKQTHFSASDVQYKTTTLNPFRVSNEISGYCAALALKKIKLEPVSDSDMLTESEVDVTTVDAAKHQCVHEGGNHRTAHRTTLKRHKQTHLPANQRPKRKAHDQPPSNEKRKKGD
ncbi:hypothetical protein [Endozoicomonas sp. 4G]|uniref:hypothetical protein n=1 Tax=Endozoicomonas sp. 4G TaxID=2872754 RepID=UPI002078D459|nr:hypothetical protein [Endozoicomonas sp. 4G]